MKRIDILGSLGFAWRFLAEHPAEFLRVCGPWFVILLLASIVQGMIGGWPLDAAMQLLVFLASLDIAVSWYQAVLIGPAAIRFAFARKELRVLFYSMVIGTPLIVVVGLLIVMPILMSAPVPVVLTICAIAVLGLMVVTQRFMLVFPAVAVEDEATTLKASWVTMRGNSLRLAAATVLAAVPSLVVNAMLLWGAPGNPGASLLMHITGMVGNVVGSGVLAAAYRLLIQAPPVVARA